MKRCIFCKKIVWFWHKTFGGDGKAHKDCDFKKFCSEIDILVKKGLFTTAQAERQKALRRTTYL